MNKPIEQPSTSLLENDTNNIKKYQYCYFSDTHEENEEADIIAEDSNHSKQDDGDFRENKRISTLNIHHKLIKKDQLISGKYIPSTLLNTIIQENNKAIVLVAAGLGVGKSTASAQLMTDQYNGIGVAVSHRRKLTSQLCASFDASNYEVVKQKDEGASIQRLGTTIQSLPSMIDNPFCTEAFNDGLLVIDESNSVASEFTGKTIKNEAATMQALKRAIEKSKTTLCLDAHVDSSTVNMLIAAGVKRSEMLLIEVEKPELEDYELRVFEAEDTKSRSELEPATINQIISDLNKGLKVIVASLSASFLDSLQTEVQKEGIFHHVKITGNTKAKVFDSLNADTYGDYQLVMLSPAMSTGISFDKDNADTCYVFLSNNEGTGSYQDGLQAMMRDRSIKSRVINCIYREAPTPLTTEQQVIRRDNRRIQALENFLQDHNLYSVFNKTRPDQDRIDAFLRNQLIKQSVEKLDFINLFISECKLKGAKVNRCKVSDFDSGNVTIETLKAEKELVEQARIDSIVTACKPEDIDLDSDIDAQPIYDRDYIERFSATDFDELSTNERIELIEKVLPSEGVGIVPRIRSFERSQQKPSTIKSLAEIALIGASNDDNDRINFAEKITTSKLHWPEQARYTKFILKACGVVETNGTLTIPDTITLDAKSVKGNGCANSLYQALKNSPEKAINCGMLGLSVSEKDLPSIKENPFPYMIDMISKAGIKLKKKRGAESYTVDTESLSDDIGFMNRRKSAGINESQEWLDRVDEYLKAHKSRKSKAQAIDAAVTDTLPESASAEATKALSGGIVSETPSNVIGAIDKALKKTSNQHMLSDAIEYLEPFHSRIDKGLFSMNNVQLLVNKFVDSQG